MAHTVTSRFDPFGVVNSSLGTSVAGNSGCHFLLDTFLTAFFFFGAGAFSL